MHRRFVALALAALVVAGMTSCSSLIKTMGRSKKDLGAPDTHALIFGSITYAGGMLGMTGTPKMKWYQVNPSAEPLTMEPGTDGDLFFIDPRPVGESWQLFSYTIKSGNTTTYYYLGFNGRQAWDFRTDKPGLLYTGSYEYHAPKLFKDDPEGLYPADDPTELDLLKDLLGKFTNTPWQSVIEARIKEMSR
jgi:hypothetical protein